MKWGGSEAQEGKKNGERKGKDIDVARGKGERKRSEKGKERKRRE